MPKVKEKILPENEGEQSPPESAPITEPYPGVPADKVADMDSCVQGVMAKDESIDKGNAIAICRKSVVEGMPLDEAIQFILRPIEAPAPVAEAATVKSKVRAAIKALDELLGERTLPEALRATVKDIREKFKTKTWADLANDAQSGDTRQVENEPQTATNPHNEPDGPGGGQTMTKQAAVKIIADYFG